MTSRGTVSDVLAHADVAVVGAGIVGLAHAVHALARGARVVVIDRDARAVGASVRNFGHGCITAQAGTSRDYALAGREHWLRLAKDAGFWLRDSGTVVVARADDEFAVLVDLARERGAEVELLDADEVATRVPVGEDCVGGAWFPLDLRVDPREAPAAIAAWLQTQGVRFLWSTTMTGADDGVLHTSRGDVRADHLVVAVGHDVDQLFPDLAEQAQVRRCSLHMLEVDAPGGAVVEPAVLSGYSLLRYDAFAGSPRLADVRARIGHDDPRSLAADVNLMYTQRPDGPLVLGDTHTRDVVADPFRDEADDDLLLDRGAALLGAERLTVRRRWHGVYASAPEPFLIGAPAPRLRVVSVTSGIGMTTAFGLAADVVGTLL